MPAWILLSLVLTAPPGEGRNAFEVKCLFCHSEEVATRPKLKPQQWHRVVESMRKRAPLLISRRDVAILTRYIVYDLKRGIVERPRPSRAPRPREDHVVKEEPPPLPPVFELDSPPEEPPPNQDALALEEAPELPAFDPAELELDKRGAEILEARCSKCHTLQRIFLKVDSIERGTAIVERMRRKTGANILRSDADLLERWLRARLGP
jgi:cytochrome c5